jgi:hypothetical protein
VLWAPVTASGLPTGNSAILKYELLWDNGEPGRTDFLLLSNALATSYTQVGVVEGSTYRFKVRAVNIYGAGADSPIASIRASDVPSRMASAVTTRSNTDIVVTFAAPTANGSPVTAYQLQIWNKGTSAYAEDAGCDGSVDPVLTSRSCTFAIATLQATFGYAVGDLVQFRARAANADGWGEYSFANTGGATIMTVPVAPSVPLEGAATSSTQI